MYCGGKKRSKPKKKIAFLIFGKNPELKPEQKT